MSPNATVAAPRQGQELIARYSARGGFVST